ncbi:hypothetical protein DRN93_05575, partial [archaeon]
GNLADVDSVSTSYGFYVGATAASGGGGREFFNGLIDEVRIYSRCLDSEEIRWLYELGRQFYPEV